MLTFILYSILVAQYAQAVLVYYADDSCDANKAIIEEELQLASDMALATSKDIEKGDYYKTMFAQSLRSEPTFKKTTARVFDTISGMLSGTKGDYSLVVTCHPSKFCDNPSYYAYMGDEKKTLNFCETFFETTGPISGTSDREKECDSMTLREAHRSKAALLIHEMTHTKYAFNYEER
jgi:hypothetical protein